MSANSATKAYNAVLKQAGATVPARDPVDTRVISDVQNLTGERFRWIASDGSLVTASGYTK